MKLGQRITNTTIKKIQSHSQPAPTIGDIVHLRKKHQDKHQVRDTFIVTDQIEDKINIEKNIECSK